MCLTARGATLPHDVQPGLARQRTGHAGHLHGRLALAIGRELRTRLPPVADWITLRTCLRTPAGWCAAHNA